MLSNIDIGTFAVHQGPSSTVQHSLPTVAKEPSCEDVGCLNFQGQVCPNTRLGNFHTSGGLEF